MAVVARSVAVARPGWPVTIVAFVGSSLAFAVITFVLAAVARPRDATRALELYRWAGRADWLRWQAATGDRMPSTPSRARAWLEAHPARGAGDDLPRIELLLWIGELETARRVALALPATTPEERFDRALEVALVSFVGSGDGDLADARAAVEELAPAGADEGDVTRARARLAVEEARRLPMPAPTSWRSSSRRALPWAPRPRASCCRTWPDGSPGHSSSSACSARH